MGLQRPREEEKREPGNEVGVEFTTTFLLFSRREENGKFFQALIKFFKRKGKNCFPQCLK